MTSVYDLASRGRPASFGSMEARLASAPYLYTTAAALTSRPTSLPLAFPGLLRPHPGSLHVPQPTKRSTGFSIEDILNHKATKVPSPIESLPPSFTKVSPNELKYAFPSPFLVSPTRPYIRFADVIHRATTSPHQHGHHHSPHPHHHHNPALSVPIPVPVYLRGKSHGGSPLDAARAAKKCRRSRTVFSELQLMGLEKRFEKQKYLSTPDRLELAETLGLSQLQVKTWYQNRRMKWKKQVMQTGGQEAPTKPKGRPKKSEFHDSTSPHHNYSDGDQMESDDDDDEDDDERSITFSPSSSGAHYDPSSHEPFSAAAHSPLIAPVSSTPASPEHLGRVL